MSAILFIDPWVQLSGQDISGRITQMQLPLTVDAPEVTAPSDRWRSYIEGLIDWTFVITAWSEYGAGKVNRVLWELVTGIATNKILRTQEVSNATASDTSPVFKGSLATITNLQLINGTVGTPSSANSTMRGTDELSYITSGARATV